MNINSDLLKNSKVEGTIYANDFKCRNMFGNYVVINGWIDGTTMRVNSVNGNRMAFIPCQPNTTYTISRSVKTSSFRVSDYTTIPSVTSSNVDYTIPTAIKNDSGTTITYTTSLTAKYIIIHYANTGSDSTTTITNSLASIQLEVGSEATIYTPYKNFENDDVYTKTEHRIGTWINGKPLYRRVIQATSLTVDGTQIIIASIPNMEFCMYLGWLSYTTGGGYTVIMNSYNPDDPTRKLYLWVDTIEGNVKYSLKNIGGDLLTVILEYTKTTD